MAFFPGADTARILTGFRTPMSAYRGLVLHVAVSEATYPSYSSGLGAHWYVRKTGSCAQQIDSRFRGGHAYQGNRDLLGVETQGGVHSPQTEPWTDAQVEALAQIVAWAHRTHGIPLRLMTSSNDSGVGWHRLGCVGAYPADLPGRNVARGDQSWTHTVGKVCPGNAKIRQIPRILARAIEIAGGAPTTTPAPATPVSHPAPTATPGLLTVDGKWGPLTTKALQRALGTPVDGVISNQYDNAVTRAIQGADRRPRRGGSVMVKALQRKLGVTADGWLGPITIRALQHRLGTPVDGVISTPTSAMVKALQRALNEGNL